MREPTVIEQGQATISEEQKPLFTVQIDPRKCLLFAYSVFVLLILFEPDYIARTSFHTLFRIAKYVAAFLAIYIFVIRNSKMNALLIGTTIFEGLLLLSTIVNGSAVEIWINNCAYIIILIIFVQTIVEIDSHVLLLALSIVLGLYTHINTVCRLLYPLGMYITSTGHRNCWFLGYDNCASVIILLAVTVALFRILYYKNCFLFWDWSVLVSGCWFIWVQRVSTAIVAGICFFVFILVSRNDWIKRHFCKGRLIIAGMFLLFFVLQFVNIQENPIFMFVLRLLGRNTSFTGRTRVWSVAWREIQNGSWLLGRGIRTTVMYQGLLGGRVWTHLHSYYLQVIYEGGFLAFAALIGMLICVVLHFDKGNYDHAYMPLLAGLLAIMLMWQAEAYGDLIKYGFVILSLMYNAPLLLQNEEETSIPRIRFTFQ